jgi:hypothetical protein
MSEVGAISFRALPTSHQTFGIATAAANKLNEFIAQNDGQITSYGNGSQGKDTLVNLRNFLTSEAFQSLNSDQLKSLKDSVRAFDREARGTFYSQKNEALTREINSANQKIDEKIASLQQPAPGAPASGAAQDPTTSPDLTTTNSDLTTADGSTLTIEGVKKSIIDSTGSIAKRTISNMLDKVTTWGGLIEFLKTASNDNRVTNKQKALAAKLQSDIEAALGHTAGSAAGQPAATAVEASGQTQGAASAPVNSDTISRYEDLPPGVKDYLAGYDYQAVKYAFLNNWLPGIAQNNADQVGIINNEIRPIVEGATTLPDLLDKLFKSPNGVPYAKFILTNLPQPTPAEAPPPSPPRPQ